MKLRLTAVALSLISLTLSSSIYAQNSQSKYRKKTRSVRSVKRVKRNKNVSEESKDIEVTVGAQRDDMTDRGGDVTEGVGLHASLGKVFYLGENFTTTSILSGNLLSLDMDDDQTSNFLSYNVGIGQRLGYRIRVGNMIVKPFIGAEVLGGRLYSSYSQTNQGVKSDASVSINYLQYGGSLGTQLILNNGFIPFIKYRVAKTVISNTATINVSGNGIGSRTETVSFNSSEEDRTMDNSTFIVGLSYLF